MGKNRIVKSITSALFIFVILVYLLTASGINSFNIDAAERHIEVTKSLIERGDLSIPERVGLKGADGRYYSWLGIGFALSAVPFYIITKLMGVPETAIFIINQIVGAATVALIFLFSVSLGYSKRVSIVVSVLYGLATMAWPLAKQPFDHILETFFVLLSVYFIHSYGMSKRIFHLLLSFSSIGFAFLIRPTSLLVIPSLALLMIVRCSKTSDFKMSIKLIVRSSLLALLCLLPFLFFSLWYNRYRFGSILETGYSLIAARAGISFFSATSLLTGLSGFLVSPGKGFFYYSPVAILFFFSIKPFIRKHRDIGIAFIFIIISYLLFLSKNIYWHGDWAWGPRYLLVITPFLIIPIAEVFKSDIWVKKSLSKIIICFIIILSFIIQISAISVDCFKYFINLSITEQVRFTELRADGLQPIREPPMETYFDWHKSPIVAQFKFIRDIAKGMKDYRYLRLADNATSNEIFRVAPILNVFDFWWLYKYFMENSYSGFIAAFILLLMSIYYGSKLWKLSGL